MNILFGLCCFAGPPPDQDETKNVSDMPQTQTTKASMATHESRQLGEETKTEQTTSSCIKPTSIYNDNNTFEEDDESKSSASTASTATTETAKRVRFAKQQQQQHQYSNKPSTTSKTKTTTRTRTTPSKSSSKNHSTSKRNLKKSIVQRSKRDKTKNATIMAKPEQQHSSIETTTQSDYPNSISILAEINPHRDLKRSIVKRSKDDKSIVVQEPESSPKSVLLETPKQLYFGKH